MVEIVQRHSIINKSAHVLSYIESVAHVMVTLCNLKRQQQLQRLESGSTEDDGATGILQSHGESYPTWAKAFAFGSSGLEANVTSSDIDVYVGRVPNMPPIPLPFPPPFLVSTLFSSIIIMLLFFFISKVARVPDHHHPSVVPGGVPGDSKAARDRRRCDGVSSKSTSGEVHA
jgi:hypothetical protein